MKTSDLIVKALENEGVEYIFGLPGEENLDLLESIRKSDQIKMITVRHEQGAGYMAATYGRLTGKAGVCMATLGPGALNLFNPAAYAQLGAMPMLMLTGQKPLKDRKQGNFQIIDVVKMLQPLTKTSKQLTYGENATSTIRELFRKSEEERPGVVHLEIPEDVAKEDVKDFTIFDVISNKIPTVNHDNLSDAKQLILNAKHPLLLIGADANRKRCCNALTKLVNTLKIPFIDTQMAKGIIDERNDLYIGTAVLSANDIVHKAIDYADLIINVGHDTIEKPPFVMSHNDDTKVIHINFFEAEINEVYFPHLNLIGDIATTVTELTKVLKNDLKTKNEYFLDIKNKIIEENQPYADDNRFPILPQNLVKLARNIIPEDGIITLDNGIYKLWFSRNYPTYSLNTLLLDNALATMGAGFASAIMTKLLHPSKKVVSINGDGGFMMNSQELETAVRLNLDLVVIILNDSAYGMIEWKQNKEGFKDYGLKYKNPDFIKYAESFGANGYKPNSVEAFKSIFEKVINEKGVHVIDLAIDYSLNEKLLG
ncbi:acetolactate synthase large subunit [Neotamlana laminarinivorans]|uniref:Acetolactate synthase large subunit n=1 Tax=Neotamlana laminarinivorans TaxID=2883124 RepID=A0A9X1HYG9_9FLAO|nr:acetolactate synthase large subunit [Tamlana laminarinivorans]MCB4797283.1 acetolactate synthase large subunit [Tamlana laminarinivorans]